MSWDLVLMVLALAGAGSFLALVGYVLVEAARAGKHRRAMELLQARRDA
jgi:hypothetical protein